MNASDQSDGRLIYVVDDDQAIRTLLVNCLQDEGFRVIEGTSGAEVLPAVQRESPDLVLMDLRMPDQSGMQALESVHGHAPEIPVLIMTAYNSSSAAIQAIQQGAYDYITKPFDPSEVVARVHALARRTHQAWAPALQTRLCAGVACLDAPNQRLEVQGTDRIIPLTKMEAQLLHVLLRNAGHVVARDQLITEAWGADYEGSSNQLEVYVHRLRRKLRGQRQRWRARQWC